MRRFLASAAAAAILLLGTLGAVVPVANAGEEGIDWCFIDPVVVVRTPGGRVEVVHVTLYGQGAEHRDALRAATITHRVQGVPRQRATAVEVIVLVPDDEGQRFATRAVVSTRPNGAGTVLATAGGQSGQPMRLRFWLNVP